MPTYEYRCRDCAHTFDVVQTMADEPLTVCPVCGGVLRKVFAPVAVSFKGSGFYATDHGKKSKEPGQTTSEKPAASTESSDNTRGKSDKDTKESSKPVEKTAAPTPPASSSGSASTRSSSDGEKQTS